MKNVTLKLYFNDDSIEPLYFHYHFQEGQDLLDTIYFLQTCKVTEESEDYVEKCEAALNNLVNKPSFDYRYLILEQMIRLDPTVSFTTYMKLDDFYVTDLNFTEIK